MCNKRHLDSSIVIMLEQFELGKHRQPYALFFCSVLLCLQFSSNSPCNLQTSFLSISLMPPNSLASLCSSAMCSSRASSLDILLLSCPAWLPLRA